ncbi:NAD(P)H-dependent oxidoreductase [Flexivirga sp.]|uniref:NAD(P)H-dependent oxidoreductase n=1 Tax=Flexivirga sp. TaxID=1962927 RepID=UPI003F7D1C30
MGDHAVDARCEGTLDPLVGHHQRLLQDADLIVLIFPLWWAGMPAVMKGWFDRVFTQGFAYGLHDAAGNSRKDGDGAFAGKRGLVITTTGDRASAFGERGLNGNIHDLLFPITHGILWYTGIAALESPRPARHRHPRLAGHRGRTGGRCGRGSRRWTGRSPSRTAGCSRTMTATVACVSSTPPVARTCRSICGTIARLDVR